MRDQYEEAFDTIVFQVSLLVFGSEGNIAAYQRIVRAALKEMHVEEVIERLRRQE